MRLTPQTDGRSHEAIALDVHDHHSRPISVSILDITTSLPPGADFDLDIPLPDSGYQIAIAQLTGPRVSTGGSGIWRESAEVVATRVAAEAKAYSVRGSSLKKVYSCTYSKQNGDSYLSHKIFDSDTGASALYIAVKDAVIVGSVLRLTFHNFYGGSAFLWVKGQATVY